MAAPSLRTGGFSPCRRFLGLSDGWCVSEIGTLIDCAATWRRFVLVLGLLSSCGLLPLQCFLNLYGIGAC